MFFGRRGRLRQWPCGGRQKVCKIKQYREAAAARLASLASQPARSQEGDRREMRVRGKREEGTGEGRGVDQPAPPPACGRGRKGQRVEESRDEVRMGAGGTARPPSQPRTTACLSSRPDAPMRARAGERKDVVLFVSAQPAQHPSASHR